MPLRRLVALAAAAGAALTAGLLAPVRAATVLPPVVTQNLSFQASDGTVLHASVGGYGSLASRPVIVEDSPYAPAASTLDWVGPAYNFVELQWRGTGVSGGSLDASGTEDQSDLSQFLGWTCKQPWSNGQIGLYGFSASAIVAYDAMHLPLPCVKAAAMMAGSTDIYRDLLDIGGIPNLAAGAFVETAIGSPTLLDGSTRLDQEPGTIPTTTLGYAVTPAEVLANTTDDAFWQERTFQGDPNHIPILADTSFYDVEPDGPFAIFNATRQDGTHLLVFGAHDGFPAGTPGPFPQYQNWFDHYLLGAPLSPANQVTVSAYVGHGGRQAFLAGDLTHLTGDTWPLAGTAWTRLYLSPVKDPSVDSFNDGSLSPQPPAATTQQAYPFVPSEPSETDLHNMSVIDTDLDELAQVLPSVTNMQLSAPTSLTYTSPPLAAPLTAVGPGAVDLYASSLDPVTDLYVVLADVWPDGTAYPIATGALRTSFPGVDRSRSMVDAAGDVVDPWNDYSTQEEAPIGATREYQIELLPMGNVFAAGSRLRLYVLGTPADQVPSPPGVNAVSLGGVTASRVLLPTIGGAPSFGAG